MLVFPSGHTLRAREKNGGAVSIVLRKRGAAFIFEGSLSNQALFPCDILLRQAVRWDVSKAAEELLGSIATVDQTFGRNKPPWEMIAINVAHARVKCDERTTANIRHKHRGP